MRKNKCVDCGIETKGHGLRCYPCSNILNSAKANNKNIKNPNYKDGRTLKKYHCKCGKEIYWTTVVYGLGRCHSCAQYVTAKQRMKTRRNYNGKNNPNFGNHKLKGKNNPRFGKSPINSKWGKYKGINMRSSWEIAYAKYLDKQDIEWQYEPKRFDLGNDTYLPDFYLPKFDCYIEIKFWWRRNRKKKFILFKKKYSKINIELLMGKDLIELGVL